MEPNSCGHEFNQRSIGLVANVASGTFSCPEKISVAFTRDPVLGIWQAMKLLSEVHVPEDTPDVSSVLAETETILFGLVLALVRRSELAGPIFASAVTMSNGAARTGRTLRPVRP
jgi:hypothetical protein